MKNNIFVLYSILHHYPGLSKSAQVMRKLLQILILENMYTPDPFFLSETIRSILVVCSRHCFFFIFKFLQVFAEYKAILQPSSADNFCLPLSLVTGVMCVKHISVIPLLMRVCNPKGNVSVLLDKEAPIHYK